MRGGLWRSAGPEGGFGFSECCKPYLGRLRWRADDALDPAWVPGSRTHELWKVMECSLGGGA